MTLEDVIARGQQLLVRCRSLLCGVTTTLDPTILTWRKDAQSSLEALGQRLVCAGCGSEAVEVSAVDAEQRSEHDGSCRPGGRTA